jgi:hypothetical protein
MTAPKDTAQLERRTVLTAAAAAAALVPVSAFAADPPPTDYPGKSSGSGTKAVEEVAHPVARPLSPDVATFFAGVEPGRTLGPATVVQVFPMTMGSIPVVLEVDGSRFQVDVLKASPSGPQAPEQTPQLAFFVSNQGHGQRITAREQHLAVRALSELLAPRDATQLKGLLTFDERRTRYPRGIYDAAG